MTADQTTSTRGKEGGRPRRRAQQPRDDAPTGRKIEVENEPLARRGGPGNDGAAPAPPVRAARQAPHRGAGAVQLAHLRRVRLARDQAHPRPHRLRGLRTHRRPRHERRGERPSLGTNERGRAGPGRLQPGGLSPARFIPRPAVPGAAGKPWAQDGPCEAGARQAPGSTNSTGLLALSKSAGNLSEWTEFVLTHSLSAVWPGARPNSHQSVPSRRRSMTPSSAKRSNARRALYRSSLTVASRPIMRVRSGSVSGVM